MMRIRLILGLAALLVAAPAAVADQYRVMVGNFFFEPSELSVLTGDTVGWRNHDGTHSTTADDFTWDSGVANAPWGFAFTFTAPGDYFYYCSVHGAPGGVGQSGVIHVSQPEGP
jgi:plastocyanin